MTPIAVSQNSPFTHYGPSTLSFRELWVMWEVWEMWEIVGSVVLEYELGRNRQTVVPSVQDGVISNCPRSDCLVLLVMIVAKERHA